MDFSIAVRIRNEISPPTAWYSTITTAKATEMRNAALLLSIYLSLDHLSRLCYDEYSVWHPTSSHAEVQ